MKSIFFILPNLEQGGAERVITLLANDLDRKKFKPVLVLFEKKGAFLNYVQSDVEIIDLKITRIRYAIFQVLNLIRTRKPDIVFGGWGEVSAFLSPFIPLYPKTKFIARETNVVSEHVKRKEIRFFYQFYHNFHRIIAQSDDMKKDLIENFKIKPDKIVKINNPVDVKFIQNQMISETQFFDSSVKNVVAVGNLTERKGFDLLLNVFTHLKNEPIHLSILGDGRDREILMKQKEELGLNQVEFLGIQQNPYPFLHQANLFVLSSRYEGFPNVLLEAGVCGTYSLANDCPGGINEIIQSGINGEIQNIQNAKEFAERIKELVHENHDQTKIQESIISRFSRERIVEKYNQILSEV